MSVPTTHVGPAGDPARFVKRWAKLAHDFHLPEHRSAHVEITSYNPNVEQYEVKLCSTGTRKIILVKASDLQFGQDFDFRYPNSPVVKWSSSLDNLPAGHTIDCTAGRSVLLGSIWRSCKVVGDRTKIYTGVWVQLKTNEDNIVEMENIIFETATHEKHYVQCASGRVIFRSCVFAGEHTGITVGSARVSDVWVTFENCSFMRSREFGVHVAGGSATFVNCTFISTGIGITAGEKTDLDVVNCTFTDCVGGVLLPSKAACDISHTTFEKMDDYSVLVSNGSYLTIRDCAINDSPGDGLVIEGGGKSTCIARDCVIRNCRTGIRAGNGKVNVELQGVTVNRCTVGIYVALDTAGMVKWDNSNTDDCHREVLNFGGSKCSAVYNSEVLGDQYGTQLERLYVHRTLEASTGVKFGYPVSASSRLLLHKAGVATLKCTNCKVSAAADQWYKKCARCRETRYCSRACQVAHFKTHRIECVVTSTKASIMSTRGYIHCLECGKVESETAGDHHSACSRCLGVFYCCRKCQVANWRDHKQNCQPLSRVKD